MSRALAAAAAALVALLAAAPAHAGCGGTVVEQAHRRVAPGPPPLAIGDSTMLLALDALAGEGFTANAHGCREFPEGLRVLRAARDSGHLGHLAVIALGADASISTGEIEAALRIMGPHRLLTLVTPRELGGGSGSDADVVRAAGRRHPRRVFVLDWVAYAAGHGGDWFQPDGLHLTETGAQVFARFLGRALRFARAPLPCPPPGSRLVSRTGYSTAFVTALRRHSDGARFVTACRPADGVRTRLGVTGAARAGVTYIVSAAGGPLVRLAGRFAAFVEGRTRVADGARSSSVVLVDLRRRRRVFSSRGIAAGVRTFGWAVRPNGTLAWIDEHAGTFRLRARRPGGAARTLARGTGIDPGFLLLSASGEVAWRDAQGRHTAHV